MINLGASKLLQHTKSLASLLVSVYPQYNWHTWKFNKVPQGFWSSIENQKQFMNWAGSELKIKDMSDWYKISIKVKTTSCKFLMINKDLIDLGGISLVIEYKRSLQKLLSAVYPNYEWVTWKFKTNSLHDTLSNSENWREFIDFTANQLNIKQPSDCKIRGKLI